ncbi:MAG TPA: hypothetical protein VFP80_05800 [Thermoanaerobaculia bacterium]|nr:hypothetical protein [Thermoanaerobaculia bacterium]
MTHGDQAKAKTAKSSQASATPKSSSKTAGQTLQGGKSGKSSKGTEKGDAGKGGKISGKATQAGPEKDSAAGKGGKARPAPAPADDTPGFSNAAVAAAFNRALKKYPNAFRKLTD